MHKHRYLGLVRKCTKRCHRTMCTLRCIKITKISYRVAKIDKLRIMFTWIVLTCNIPLTINQRIHYFLPITHHIFGFPESGATNYYRAEPLAWRLNISVGWNKREIKIQIPKSAGKNSFIVLQI